MPDRIAVLFVHGVEIRDPDYAKTAIRKLQREFAKRAGITAAEAAEALIIETVYWVPALEPHEERLLASTYTSDASRFYGLLDRWVAKVDAGSAAAIVPLALSALLRWVPGVRGLAWPTLRWLGTYFVGDAVAYQITPWDRRVYDSVHATFADPLARLAARAGPDAPLCIISHSLGTVVASDHMWDLQHRNQGEPAGPTPLECGDTLAFMYTLGSPIALWALRYPDFGTPIAVPALRLEEYHPNLQSEWINFYSPEDIVAYPVRGLSAEYAAAVDEDRLVRVGPPIISMTPVSHPWYWNDDKVIKPIAQTLSTAWNDLSAGLRQNRTKAPRSTSIAQNPAVKRFVPQSGSLRP